MDIHKDLIYKEVNEIDKSNTQVKSLLKYKSKTNEELHIKGRIAAKQCLEKLGIKNFEILKQQSGAPIWPKEVYGSIAAIEP